MDGARYHFYSGAKPARPDDCDGRLLFTIQADNGIVASCSLFDELKKALERDKAGFLWYGYQYAR